LIFPFSLSWKGSSFRGPSIFPFPFSIPYFPLTPPLNNPVISCLPNHSFPVDTPGYYIVCEYYPAGNVIGAFNANVQAQVKGRPTDTIESGISGANGTGGASGTGGSSGGGGGGGSGEGSGIGGVGEIRIPWLEAMCVLAGALAVAVAL
jgi:hypothetical protein